MTKETLEDLYKKRQALDARIELIKAKDRERQRKEETRKKILLGAFILQHQGEGVDWQAWLKKLDGFLERENDRKLFGLPVEEKEPA